MKMIIKQLTIINELGLHARPAAKVVRLAAQHQADLFVSYENARINAKSIMGLMMLAVEKGGTIKVEIDGEDEALLMEKIEQLVSDGFGEM